MSEISQLASNSHAIRDFIVNILLTAGMAGLMAFGVYLFAFSPSQNQTESHVLIIDTERLAREQINVIGDLVANNKIPPESMPERSQKFSEGLLREIQGYADHGYIVLRSVAVLAAPESVQDITNEVRQRLIEKGIMDSSLNSTSVVDQ